MSDTFHNLNTYNISSHHSHFSGDLHQNRRTAVYQASGKTGSAQPGAAGKPPRHPSGESLREKRL